MVAPTLIVSVAGTNWGVFVSLVLGPEFPQASAYALAARDAVHVPVALVAEVLYVALNVWLPPE